MNVAMNVNGKPVSVIADDPDMPLLYALRNDLDLHGPRFGCGLGQCGSCTVHIDGRAMRSCVTPVRFAQDKQVVTLEGLGTPDKPHALQQAFIDEQAVQCGYCINGMVMQAASLLKEHTQAQRGADSPSACEQPVPLRHACADRARRAARCGEAGMSAHHPSLEAGRPLDAPETDAGFDALRRRVLLTGGALFVGFASARARAAELTTSDPDEKAGVTPEQKLPGKDQRASVPDGVDGFLAIDASGKVTVYSGKVDLGTGVRTAIAQMAAEELSVPMSQVEVVQGDTLLTPDQGPTYGSLSIQVGGAQIRLAAATARDAMLGLAAQRLKVAKDQLTIAAGNVRPAAGGAGIGYAQLVGGTSFNLKVDKNAKVKDPKDHTIVGRSVPRLDIPDKLFGTFTYMQDFKRDDMLHARIVRPPAMQAELQSVDDSACKSVAGYRRHVRKGSFLAVLADTEWGAIKASRAIQANWSDWAGLPDESKLWEHVRSTQVAKSEDLQKTGDTATAMKTGDAKTLSATYDFAIHTHGSIGPSCAVAEYRDGQLTCWTASQQTHLLHRQLVQMLGMKPENVRCIYIEGAGCYGRNGHEDAASDAALLALETAGRPVRVQWMRQEEHGWDPKGPPTLIDYRAAVGADGAVLAWESEAFLPDRPKEIAVTLLTAEMAALPHYAAHPGNIHQGLAIPYDLPNIHAQARWLGSTPFRPSWIRTPGRMQNTFGNESFLDEIAASKGLDPFEFRVRNLNDPRGLEVLERLRKLSNWQPRKAGMRASGDVMTGRGVSYTKYELVRTYVGVVADVEVDRRSGKVTVKKLYVAHDCGQIINPDGLRNQIEGNMLQTVSRTLLEELKFDRSTVTSTDWASYPILRFPDVPQVVMELIDRPHEKPWGAGEPSAAVVPSAIGNAVFDATGARLRSVPFLPAKVLAAL